MWRVVIMVGVVSACQCRRSDVVPASPGELAVAVERVDFQSTSVGQQRTATIDVVNTGSEALSVDVAFAPPFSVDADAFVLRRDETHSLTVTFAPSRSGVATSTLSIGLLRLEVSGKGSRFPNVRRLTCATR